MTAKIDHVRDLYRDNKRFKSYLDNRTQKCFVNGSLSDSQPFDLRYFSRYNPWSSPFNFILYINDLPNCLVDCPRMYADDTRLTIAKNHTMSRTIQENMHDDRTKITEWLTPNSLTLNKSKTEFMLIGSRQRLYTLIDSRLLLLTETL